jgi:hypothetical protein
MNLSIARQIRPKLIADNYDLIADSPPEGKRKEGTARQRKEVAA